MSPHLTQSRLTRSAAPTIALLHADALALLNQALDQAVAGDASLAQARAALLAPLRLLEALALEAEAALGDDVLAAERLRLLITLAESDTPSSMVTSMLGMPAAVGLQPGSPCKPGLIDLGALTIVALAAGRVGRRLGLAEPMINNVLSLALAAGPAESLTRAIAAGMTSAQIAAVLAGLAAHNAANRTISATVAAFVADPCERARWSCLAALFEQVRGDVEKTEWEAAEGSCILSVDPVDACSGEVITITLDTNALPREGALDAAHFLPLLADHKAQVVFAAPGNAPIAVDPTSVDVEAGTLQAKVPEQAGPGWVGLFDPALLLKSNESRNALKAACKVRNGESNCLRGTPIPEQSIPLLSDPATPPRSPSAVFEGGEPLIAEAALSPAVVASGGLLQLVWRVENATDVTIEPEPGLVASSGKLQFTAGAEHAQFQRKLIASNRCGQSVEEVLTSRVRARITDLRIEQDGRTTPLVFGKPLQLRVIIEPPDVSGPVRVVAGTWVREQKPVEGRVEVTIPETVLTQGLAGNVRVLGPEGKPDDERSFGPLTFVISQQRTIVLIRPASVTRSFKRVSAFDAQQVVQGLQSVSANVLDVIEPAWIDDEDITCASDPNGPDTPETLRLLERLNVLAARHPGLEDALWVALVPGPLPPPPIILLRAAAASSSPAPVGFFRIESADAARAVAVCTPDQLGALLAEPLPPVEASTERLRVIAYLGPDGSVRFESMRVEERMAGQGAPLLTELTVFGVAGKSVRTTQPLRAMTRTRPLRVVALLPITPAVDAIELRSPRSEVFAIVRSAFDGDRDPLHLRRVIRPAGQPTVSKVELAEITLSWDYSHTRSARASFTVEVGRGDVWSPIAVLGGCDEQLDLPLARIATAARAERVRVVASDGWNTDATPVRGIEMPAPPAQRVLARFAGQRTFWADLDFDGGEFDEDNITWSFGEEQKTGHLLTLPRKFYGTVTLTVTAGEGTLTDTRTIERDGSVDDRNVHWPVEGSRV